MQFPLEPPAHSARFTTQSIKNCEQKSKVRKTKDKKQDHTTEERQFYFLLHNRQHNTQTSSLSWGQLLEQNVLQGLNFMLKKLTGIILVLYQKEFSIKKRPVIQGFHHNNQAERLSLKVPSVLKTIFSTPYIVWW